jgi:hypothetical protein
VVVVVEAPPIAVPDPDAGLGEAAPEVEALPPPVGDASLPPDPATDAPAAVAGPGGTSTIAGPDPDPEPAAAAPPEPPTPPVTEPPPPPTTLPEVDDAVAAADPERLWVVSIGIDDYPGERFDLSAADDDAIAVTDAFANLGVPADHMYELLNGAATVEGVLGAVDWLVEHAGADDTAVFFYAGHVREVGHDTEVLVTSEGGWIADWFLASRFDDLASDDAWFAIAGCYGGGFIELLGPGRILTAAAPDGELAYESSALGRSYMVEYLFGRAIAQRAVVPTVQAAVAWANERLAADHPEHTLWHQDEAGHVVSLDGADRRSWPIDGAPPPPPPPPTTAPPRRCLLGILCG